MSERENNSIPLRAASGSVQRFMRNMLHRSILALAALVALVFVSAGPSRAQSQSAASKSASAGATAPTEIAPANLVPVAQTAAPKPTAEPAGAKAISTGIQVHGHWTIEVRNPDGSLVRHVEFENSIDPGFIYFQGGVTFNVPGGAAYLNALMSGQAGPPAGSWTMILTGDPGLGNLSDTSTSPCINLPPVNSELPGPAFGYCLLSQAGPGGFCAQYNSSNPPPAGTSCNLSVTSLGTLPNLTGVQITGTIAATQAGQIETVATLVGAPCTNTSTCFTTGGVPFSSFTSSSGFPGAPVKIATAGQVIAVTVQLSFQ